MSHAMSRQERREAERYLARENAKWPATMKEWPRDDWPDGPMHRAANLIRVFRSRDFLVQVFAEPAPAIARLSICRSAITGDRWTDGISWEELQAIKDQCGYAESDAVEVFPATEDVVNVANVRHLWVMAEPLTFAWRDKGEG